LSVAVTVSAVVISCVVCAMSPSVRVSVAVVFRFCRVVLSQALAPLAFLVGRFRRVGHVPLRFLILSLLCILLTVVSCAVGRGDPARHSELPPPYSGESLLVSWSVPLPSTLCCGVSWPRVSRVDRMISNCRRAHDFVKFSLCENAAICIHVALDR